MNKLTLIRSLLALSTLAFVLNGCGEEPEPTSAPETEASESADETETEEPAAEIDLRDLAEGHFEAIESIPIDEAKLVLGRRLFHDTNLSGDNTIACVTCHSLGHGGAEDRATSRGIGGQIGPINSPTVINASYNFRQFWDGRAADLLEQAAGPVLNPIEMGGNWEQILERLNADADYPGQFQAAYNEGPSQAHALEAIAEYERHLSTPGAFDRWLGGDDSALNESQQAGLRTFVETGCTTCHRGQNIGGSMYQRMGLVNNYFEERGGELTEADQGRFNVTHEESDRHRFKVPTLRNVIESGPYFHDGSESSLSGAVRTMAHVQLGRELDDAQVESIVFFLGSLSGELPADARMPSAEATPEVAPSAEPAATH